MSSFLDTARWTRRASSMPLMTSTSIPVSPVIRSARSFPFSASRMALVAMAAECSTPCSLMDAENLWNASRARSMISGESRPFANTS